MNKTLSPCDLGRTASHFYIRHDSIELYNDGLEKTGHISTMFLFNLVASSKEFAQLKIRNEEMDELDRLAKEAEYNIIGEVYFQYSHFSWNRNIWFKLKVRTSKILILHERWSRDCTRKSELSLADLFESRVDKSVLSWLRSELYRTKCSPNLPRSIWNNSKKGTNLKFPN